MPDGSFHPVRLLFIDNIRIFLVSLVILTHLAITYGAVGYWYYKEVVGIRERGLAY